MHISRFACLGYFPCIFFSRTKLDCKIYILLAKCLGVKFLFLDSLKVLMDYGVSFLLIKILLCFSLLVCICRNHISGPQSGFLAVPRTCDGVDGWKFFNSVHFVKYVMENSDFVHIKSKMVVHV